MTESGGGYHCHKASCYENQSQTINATLEAVAEDRSFSTIYRRADRKHWIDEDGDCMNTRHEILQAQADGPIVKSSDGCHVTSGTWNEPFGGELLTQSSDLDVDHIIPLKWANVHGGSNWSPEKKQSFANDPRNLLAVDDGLNQSKGAKGPSEWMPPNQNYHCEYLGLWQSILTKYPALTMTNPERSVFERRMDACT